MDAGNVPPPGPMPPPYPAPPAGFAPASTGRLMILLAIIATVAAAALVVTYTITNLAIMAVAPVNLGPEASFALQSLVAAAEGALAFGLFFAVLGFGARWPAARMRFLIGGLIELVGVLVAVSTELAMYYTLFLGHTGFQGIGQYNLVILGAYAIVPIGFILVLLGFFRALGSP